MARTENTSGDVIDEIPLDFAGETSMFEGTMPFTPEATRLVVVASQPEEANFGRVERDL